MSENIVSDSPDCLEGFSNDLLKLSSTATTTNKMDLTEFKEAGFLQELNRCFLHPLGLALEVVVEANGSVSHISGVWDYRDDPEGITYGDTSATTFKRKREYVNNQRKKTAKTRKKLLGYVIQPIGDVRKK